MKDLLENLEKLHADAEVCALIGNPATDKVDRERFGKLANQLRWLQLVNRPNE
jgi:hypothetical protein